uniref:Uncharacterized protein n=1 Tax=Oryza meridionalis TaxID=40149 RepID=A0A0E0EFX3_9ORYZ
MGRLRGKVFPACFALNAACTAAFAWLHRPPWPLAERRQLAVLLVAAGPPRTLEVRSPPRIPSTICPATSLANTLSSSLSRTTPPLAATSTSRRSSPTSSSRTAR